MRSRSLEGVLTRAFLGTAILILATASTALGVEPPGDPGAEPPPLPDGVTADATVTVRFLLPAAGGPIADAGVVLTVTRAGATLQEAWGLTDADGVATFEGVARASDGGDPTLATAYAWTEAVPPDEGCAVVSSWKGVTSDVPVGMVTDIDVEATEAEGEVCVGGGGGELPDGVSADASLVVTVLDGESQPVPFAEVTVVAWVGDETGSFWAVGATADETGRATFTDLPRPDDGGPAVTWRVDAWSADGVEVDGCTFITSRSGSAELAAAAGASSVEVTTTTIEESFGWCAEPGDDAPILQGTVSGPDGAPLAGARGALRMVRGDGATWDLYEFTTDENGAFEVRIQPWGTAGSPASLMLEVRGEVTRTEPTEDATCDMAFGLLASFSGQVSLADGGTVEAVTMAAAEGEFGLLCDEVPGSESDGAAGGGPRGDLPATDTLEPAGRGGVDLGRGTAILLTAALAAFAILRRRPAVTDPAR